MYINIIITTHLFNYFFSYYLDGYLVSLWWEQGTMAKASRAICNVVICINRNNAKQMVIEAAVGSFPIDNKGKVQFY